MMYKNKLAVAIKANGKVLREKGENVFLPFSSQYSILLKNLNSVRAMVNVSIDGVDIAEGVSFIVDPNSEFEIERFIKNGNLKEGNSFKFIERTDSVEQHRGIKTDDGIIRIQFQFEKPQLKNTDLDDIKRQLDKLDRKVDDYPYRPYYYYWPYYWPNHPYNPHYEPRIWCGGPLNGSVASNSLITTANGLMANSVAGSNAASGVLRSANVNAVNYSAPVAVSEAMDCSFTATADLNDAGITVPGAKSDQTFHTTAAFEVESEVHVMVIKLLGETGKGKVVKQAISVKAKPTCTTCGRVNKATNKFCSDCGTALEII